MRKDIPSTAAWLLALLVFAIAIVGAGSYHPRPMPKSVPPQTAVYPHVPPVDINPCSSGACW